MSDDLAARVTAAADLLEAIVADRGVLAHVDGELRERLLIAAGRVARPDPKARRRLARERRKQAKADKRAATEALLDQTGIRKLRENPIFQTPRRRARGAPPPPALGTLPDARVCYTCQQPYTAVHHFYDHLCPACGDLNYDKRFPEADLRGRVALVTGARVKIGYQAAIMLLRNGCHVIVVTRFPKDAAKRYAAEADADDWCDRLEIHGLDLRHTPSVEAFCARILASHDRLDCLINNACQTVRRPTGFYDHLLATELGTDALTDRERALLGDRHALTVDDGVSSAALSQVKLTDEDHHAGTALFPPGQFDADLQQVDLREVNSWRLAMHEVGTVELLEVQLVNAVAPYLLNARLKPLLAAVPTNDAHVVNVSAVEGQFYRTFKSARHPHTNMAKAALNMMTRTAAMDYVEVGVHMNSVDTGWVTDEDPVAHAERKKAEHRFHPPLDIVDGAARIVDPFIDGLNTGDHVWGQFLKDYKPTDW